MIQAVDLKMPFRAFIPKAHTASRRAIFDLNRICWRLQRQGKCPGLTRCGCKGDDCRTYRHYAGLMAR